jgi:ribosomal protein S18 acetylase RimI-like enzyme
MSTLPSLNVSNPSGEILILNDVKFASQLAQLHANCLPEELFASFPRVLQKKIYLMLLKSSNYRVVVFKDFSTVSIVAALILKKTNKSTGIYKNLSLFFFFHYFLYWILKNPIRNARVLLNFCLDNRYKLNGEYAEIRALYVEQQFRGQRIGRSLLAYLSEMNIKPCIVSTKKNNTQAKEVYRLEKFIEYAQSDQSIWYVKH